MGDIVDREFAPLGQPPLSDRQFDLGRDVLRPEIYRNDNLRVKATSPSAQIQANPISRTENPFRRRALQEFEVTVRGQMIDVFDQYTRNIRQAASIGDMVEDLPLGLSKFRWTHDFALRRYL